MSSVSPRESISWLSVLTIARVPYGIVLLIGIGLLAPPQLQDMLAAVEHRVDMGAVSFSIAFFTFATWYWARATVAAYFELNDGKSWKDEHTWNGRVLTPKELRTIRYVAYGPIITS